MFDLAQLQIEVIKPSSETPIPTANFKGREAEFERIHNHLNPDNMGQKVVVLWGLPGFGKTQLAIHYKLKFQKCYSCVLWADASYPGSMRDSYFEIAQNIDKSLTSVREEQFVSVVRQWLSRATNSKWLLILDGYDSDYFDIRPFLPGGECRHGSLILTTIRSKIADPFNALSVQIDRIDENAGTKILLSKMRIKSPEQNGLFTLKLKKPSTDFVI